MTKILPLFSTIVARKGKNMPIRGSIESASFKKVKLQKYIKYCCFYDSGNARGIAFTNQTSTYYAEQTINTDDIQVTENDELIELSYSARLRRWSGEAK